MPVDIFKRPPWQGIVGGVCLAANYYGMIEGIRLSGPSNAGILIQIAPVMVVILGILAFKERMSRDQVFGFFVASGGFYLFCIDQQSGSHDVGLYHSANSYIFFAAVVWVGFMACQKRLSLHYPPQNLNLLVFVTATLALAPWVDWTDFLRANLIGWALLVSLGLNTLFAYGALAEAVRCVPLSYISVTTSLNPLITVGLMQWVGNSGGEWLPPDALGLVGWVGAMLAVVGVVLVVRKN
jgi:drug/metabolite transporter (DMT)-like permease